ncbi:MAG: hypothetical protein ACRDYX_09220, partial [Egibacteraceae bacterium]
MSADRTQRRSRSNPGGGWADRLGAGRLWGAFHARSVGGQVVDCDAACGGGVVEAGVHAAPESALVDNVRSRRSRLESLVSTAGHISRFGSHHPGRVLAEGHELALTQ